LPRRAAPVRRGREGGVAGGAEGLSLREQSFLGEVGRERGHPQGGSRPAAARRVHPGDGGALSGSERSRQTATGVVSLGRPTFVTPIFGQRSRSTQLRHNG